MGLCEGLLLLTLRGNASGGEVTAWTLDIYRESWEYGGADTASGIRGGPDKLRIGTAVQISEPVEGIAASIENVGHFKDKADTHYFARCTIHVVEPDTPDPADPASFATFLYFVLITVT